MRAGEAVAGDDAMPPFQCQGHKQPAARVIYGHDWLQPSTGIALRTHKGVKQKVTANGKLLFRTGEMSRRAIRLN